MELCIAVLCRKRINSGGFSVNVTLSNPGVHFNKDITGKKMYLYTHICILYNDCMLLRTRKEVCGRPLLLGRKAIKGVRMLQRRWVMPTLRCRQDAAWSAVGARRPQRALSPQGIFHLGYSGCFLSSIHVWKCAVPYRRSGT